MQILDPTTGLRITIDQSTGRSRTSARSEAKVPAFHNSILQDHVRNGLELRSRNGVLRWSSGNAVVNKNNYPLFCHSYRLHPDWESARFPAGQEPRP